MSAPPYSYMSCMYMYPFCGPARLRRIARLICFLDFYSARTGKQEMHSSFAPRCCHISVLSRSNRRHRLRRIPECCAYASTSRNFSSKHASTPARKVVVTARAFPETTDLLASAGLNVVSNRSIKPWSREELISHAQDARAILAFMTDSVDEGLLDACPHLELVACALKGYDNFSTDLCAERGVAVTAVPDLLTQPTAELALLLALGLGRRIREADHAVRSGEFRGWRPSLYGTGLTGATVGIYGAGAVGRAVAKMLRGFEPKRILYRDPAPAIPIDELSQIVEPVESLEELMCRCDFVFVCTPLNKSTYHAIDANVLAQAKPGMFLVNISRGSCVDEHAVVEALHSDRLGGYAADVFEFEDWILEDRPDAIEPRLLLHPRTLFSPHLGSAVVQTRRDIEVAAAEEIIRWSCDEPFMHRVN